MVSMVHLTVGCVLHRYSCLKSFLVGLTMTLFPVFDVPVFWPILLMYWIVLFVVTMKRQIKHMIKYKYLPFSFGKKVRCSSMCGEGCVVHCDCLKNELTSVPSAVLNLVGMI